MSDASGARQATLAFRPETQAFAVLPDGSEEPLSELTVRATEFTVGDSGVAAMPGNLPATSGYTYALELSVDEAEALSARHVRFSKPVAFYLENFLDFPVGESVPAGFYDRDTAAWQPSDSGVVLRVLDVNGDAATVDLDGDGVAEDEAALSDAGIAAEELEQVAQLYAPGQSLWRVELDHFSSWDYNWPFGPPNDAVASPYASEPPADSDKDNTACGSIIHCESQVLGEKLDLVGTPLSLNYQTNRTQGRRAAFETDIRLSGDTIPASLKAITLEISIEGQRLRKRFEPKPGLSEHFVWDGRDGYGRLLQGQHVADIRVGYVYDGVYKQGTRFGAPSGVSIDGSKTRQEVTLWRDQPRTLGTFDAAGLGLGGLMLSEHHAYDPKLQVLYQGDGTQRSARSLSHVLQEIYVAPPIHLGPDVLLAAPDGGLYMSDDLNRVLYRNPSGDVQVVAGTGESGFSGDGGPASEAQLDDPAGLALKPDGTLLIADSFNGRIRAVTPDGKINTIAGGGSELFSEGLPALEADLSVTDLVYAPDGSIYFTGYGDSHVRRIAPDGTLATVAGSGAGSVKDPDAENATDAYLSHAAHLRRGPDGSLYFTESVINHRLRRLWPSGRLETLATEAEGIGNVTQIELMPDGSILLAQDDALLRYVPGQGLVPFLGGGNELQADGVIAETAKLSAVRGLARGYDGSLYLTAPTQVFRVAPAMPSLSLTDVVLPSVDGQQLFVFSGEGRHRATRDAFTGIEQLRFEYDGPWLVGIRDAFDAKTTLKRDQDGALLAIVGPDGQGNEVALDDAGRLTELTDPIGRVTHLGYDDAGLLSELTDRRGGVHRFGYDASGRLTSDEGPTGFLQTLERASTASGFTVSLQTPLGRTRRYSIERTPEGNELRRLVTADGLARQTTRRAAQLETLAPDGTLTRQQLAPDKRFAMQTPRSSTIQTTPGGRTLQLSQETQFTPADPADPFGLGKTTQLSSRAGLTTTTTYDAATGQLSIRSPAGRVATFVLGQQGQVVEATQPGLATSYLEYDDRGRLLVVTTGSGTDARSSTFSYAADGLLAELTDALGHTTTLSRDGAGRVTASTTSAGKLSLGYDEHDNVTQVTPPGRKPYGFGFDAADHLVSSTEPTVASKRFQSSAEYNADLQLTKTTSADGQVIERSYDDAGRLTSTKLPSGTLSRSYSPQGQLSKLTTPEVIPSPSATTVRCSSRPPPPAQLPALFSTTTTAPGESARPPSTPTPQSVSATIKTACSPLLAPSKSNAPLPPACPPLPLSRTPAPPSATTPSASLPNSTPASSRPRSCSKRSPATRSVASPSSAKPTPSPPPSPPTPTTTTAASPAKAKTALSAATPTTPTAIASPSTTTASSPKPATTPKTAS